MENRTINEKYAEIAQEWIDTDRCFTDIANSHAAILYLSSDYDKRKRS